MHPLLRKIWNDMWGPELSLGDAVLVMEHILLKQGRSEMEVARLVGQAAGNIFKAREHLTDLFAEKGI
jgi:hypothetical protein